MRIINDFWFDEFDREKFCVDLGDPATEAVRKMKALGTRALVVLGKDGRYLGVIGYSRIGNSDSPINDSLIERGVWCLETSSVIPSSMDFVPILSAEFEVVGCKYRPVDLGREGIPESVTIIGAGYVGFTLGLGLAAKGVTVNFVDNDPERIKLFSEGRVPFFERGLQEVFDNLKSKLDFFNDLKKPHHRSPYVIVTVGTPLTKGKQPNLEYFETAVKAAIEFIDDRGLICFRSTVPVGHTSMVVNKYLSDINEKHLSVAFCPERTVEGDAINELSKNPQFIGVRDPLALRMAFSLFSAISEEAVVYTNYELAELSKLADNVSRDIYFGVSNFFARVSRELGLSGSHFIKHLNHNYARNHLARPSVGVGGPCLSKDYYLLRSSINSAIDGVEHLELGREQNRSSQAAMIASICELRDSGFAELVICVGMAFKGKPETSDIRDSIGVEIFEMLAKKINQCVVWFDPSVYEEDLSKSLSDRRLTELPKSISSNIVFVVLNDHDRWSSIDFGACVDETHYCHILDGFYSNSLESQRIHDRRVIYKPW
ncbi:nucleotide sugar dehydrogenase [Litoricolaceae bacterium]|nr:nucleotide sugar dehydrogenase [Litorivicinaceae bacterium]